MRVKVVVVVSAVAAVVAAPAVAAGRSGGRTTCSDGSPQLAIPRTTTTTATGEILEVQQW